MKQNIMMVSYAFPPTHSVAIHRVLRISKELKKLGYNIYVVTAKNRIHKPKDKYYDNVVYEVYTKVEEVNGKLDNLIVKIAQSKKKFIKIFYLIINIFSIPDVNIFWNSSALKSIRKLILSEKIDIIWITMSPFSSGLLVQKIKRKINIPIILDYRDPWSLNDVNFDNTFKKILYNNNLRKKLNIKFESSALTNVDYVTVVSRPMMEEMVSNKFISKDRISVITNCYCNDKQLSNTNLNIKFKKPAEKYIMTYAGNIYLDRNPEYFIKGLSLLFKKSRELREKFIVNFIGKLNTNQIKKIALKYGVLENINCLNQQPYATVMQYIASSDALLLLNGTSPGSKRNMTGKFFDYLSVRKPILFVGEGVLEEIIKAINIGECSTHNPEEISEALERLYNKKYVINENELEKYSCTSVTKKLEIIIQKLLDR